MKCNRDQEIARGLERGENVGVEKCGCVIIQDRTADAYIIYCHEHKAAPDCHRELVEADKVICQLCKRLNPQHAQSSYYDGCVWCQDRENRLKALAKAEGK